MEYRCNIGFSVYHTRTIFTNFPIFKIIVAILFFHNLVSSFSLLSLRQCFQKYIRQVIWAQQNKWDSQFEKQKFVSPLVTAYLVKKSRQFYSTVFPSIIENQILNNCIVNRKKGERARRIALYKQACTVNVCTSTMVWRNQINCFPYHRTYADSRQSETVYYCMYDRTSCDRLRITQTFLVQLVKIENDGLRYCISILCDTVPYLPRLTTLTEHGRQIAESPNR